VTERPTEIVFLLFPDLTQLDLTGPYEVLAALPNVRLTLVARSLAPVRSASGLSIVPHATYEGAPRPDVLVIPGGGGVNALLGDATTLAFVRTAARDARYVVSVCTGALVLGAAGLLRGRRAATHWFAREFLAAFGAEAVAERVVVDGRFVTGGGVTAGIDVALRLAAELGGRETAERLELALEYDPAPPFGTGSPERAGPELVRRHRDASTAALAARRAAVRAASEAHLTEPS